MKDIIISIFIWWIFLNWCVLYKRFISFLWVYVLLLILCLFIKWMILIVVLSFFFFIRLLVNVLSVIRLGEILLCVDLL